MPNSGAEKSSSLPCGFPEPLLLRNKKKTSITCEERAGIAKDFVLKWQVISCGNKEARRKDGVSLEKQFRDGEDILTPSCIFGTKAVSSRQTPRAESFGSEYGQCERRRAQSGFIAKRIPMNKPTRNADKNARNNGRRGRPSG